MTLYQKDAQERALRDAVEYVYGCGVNGHIAEFGCFFGQSAEILAKAISEMEQRYKGSDLVHGNAHIRWLWLLDSFRGFPEPTHPVDVDSPHIKAKAWRAGHMSGGSPVGVHYACSRYLAPDRIVIAEGWFKDTLDKLPDQLRLAVAHIDCDFYESTVQVLMHLFANKMFSDGATILFDDWYCNRGSPRFGEQAAWRDATQAHNVNYTDWGPYGAFGRRFIVHEG